MTLLPKRPFRMFSVSALLILATSVVGQPLAASADSFSQQDSADVAQEVIIGPGEKYSASSTEPVEISAVDQDAPEVIQPSAQQSTNANPAPYCVVAYKEKGAIQVENNCGYDLRIKVIVAFSPDTGCKTVIDGTRTNIGFRPIASIDGVVVC